MHFVSLSLHHGHYTRPDTVYKWVPRHTTGSRPAIDKHNKDDISSRRTEGVVWLLNATLKSGYVLSCAPPNFKYELKEESWKMSIFVK